MGVRELRLVVVAAVALAGSAAHATMIVTGRLAAEPDGWVACTAVNRNLKPLDMRIEIRNSRGGIVTDYILTERNDDGVLARVLAESHQDDAVYCRLHVRRGFRRDVDVVLESFDRDGVLSGWVGPGR